MIVLLNFKSLVWAVTATPTIGRPCAEQTERITRYLLWLEFQMTGFVFGE